MSRPSSSQNASTPTPTSASPHPPRLPLPPLNHNPLRPPAQSTSNTAHPLLAPLGQPSAISIANTTSQAELPVIPEKCLTFCSQRDEASPLCRMFCLRRREPQRSQAEQLVRLRPQRRLISSSSDEASTSTASGSASTSTFSPFESLRKTLEPYSLVYVKGTPDGVVGRYMEEMEFDDGQHDFGAISRNSSALQKRKREVDVMTFLDWGDHGSMAYLPLTSIFHPILSIPDTIHRVLSPTLNFLSHYRESFTNGAQTRALMKFREEVENGGAFTLWEKANKHVEKKTAEAKERFEKAKEAKAAAQAKAQNAQAVGGKVEEEKAGVKSTRQGLEEKARERIARQIQAESERVKKVGEEAEGKGQ